MTSARALATLFGGADGKDIVSPTWRKVKGDGAAWNARSLTDEPIVRLTGHRSLEAVERYTRAARKKALANSAIAQLKG